MPTKTAKDIMKAKVVTVNPSTSIEEAARLLVRRKISEVPVVDEKDKTKLVGILTEADLLAAPAGAKTIADVMKRRVVPVSPDTSVEEIVDLVKKKLRRRANALVRELSPERLQFAVEFLEFLKEREEREATLDILTDPKMTEMIERAEADRKAGRKDAFIPWERVKRGEV